MPTSSQSPSARRPRVICHMMTSIDQQRLALEAVERRADDVLWLRYRVVSR